jgi:hypothetical protein
MKHATFRFIVLIFSVTTIGAWTEAITAQAQQRASDDKAGAYNDISAAPAEGPEQHFKKARENFLKKDMKAAAAEIRKSAEFLKHEEELATSEGKKDLMVSTHALEKTADDIEKGTVTSVNRLDHVFANAYHALARSHYLKASESWAKKNAKEAGFSLRVSSWDLEHGLAWSRQKVEGETERALKDARHVSGKLIKGTGWISSEVDKSIEDIGREIDIFRKEMTPKGM